MNFDTYHLNMSKMKVVVTRNLNQEAQSLLDSQSTDLEVVKWQSDQVRAFKNGWKLSITHTHSLASGHGYTKRQRSDGALGDGV
jgi:hypothetical protein